MAEIPESYHGKALTHAWVYRDPGGELVGLVARYDDGRGRKSVVPHFQPNGAGWLAGGPEAPAPLFGAEVLAAYPDRPALVCEGEKCAAASPRAGVKEIFHARLTY